MLAAPLHTKLINFIRGNYRENYSSVTSRRVGTKSRAMKCRARDNDAGDDVC